MKMVLWTPQIPKTPTDICLVERKKISRLCRVGGPPAHQPLRFGEGRGGCFVLRQNGARFERKRLAAFDFDSEV